MKNLCILLSPILLFLCLVGCHSATRTRSDRSFDEIRNLVQGKTASEVEALLGAPDTRQTTELGTVQWIWWNYTYLGGKDYAPEFRNRPVHLQIVFADPSLAEPEKTSVSNLRIVDPSRVSFLLPSAVPDTTQ